MANNQLFNKEALDKLRTPERLDSMLSITTPINWLILLVIAIYIMAAILWSIYGAFTVKVDGVGMLTDSGGIDKMIADNSGTVEKIYVQPGDKVKGLEPFLELSDYKKKIDSNMARYDVRMGENRRDVQNKVHTYAAKENENSINSKYYMTSDGIVDEVMVKPGDYISPGQVLCTVRKTQDRDELSGVLYVPVDKGKRIEPGMSVQLVPSGVDSSESGSLLGMVKSVSQYPINMQTAQNTLANNYLAQWFTDKEKSALMEVKFVLIKDDKDGKGNSSYLWTTSVGDHKEISAGTYVTGSIIVERRPPIDRIFYKISQGLRSR